jgi:DNA polymerase I
MPTPPALAWIEAESRAAYARIEHRGVPVDNPLLKRLIEGLQSEYVCTESRIKSLTGLRVRPNSSDDISAAARSFGIELSRTPRGRHRTDRRTLSAHNQLKEVIRLKELRNKLSTALGIQRRIVGGRLWPKYVFRPELGRPHVEQVSYISWPQELRPTLIPEPGQVFVVADFEGMELRVLATLSGDRRLQADLEGDFHRATAAQVFEIDRGTVTEDQRQIAKTLNFAMLYGSSASGLAYRLRIEESQGQRMIQRWREAYPDAVSYVQRVQREGLSRGWTDTYHGRRRDLSGLVAVDPGKARRLAINHVIQSTAGDLMRIGLIRLQPAAEALGGRVLGTLHDSYLLSLPASMETSRILQSLRDTAINGNDAGFNLRMKVSIGPRWGRYEQEHRI